jgi:hypothetical protein
MAIGGSAEVVDPAGLWIVAGYVHGARRKELAGARLFAQNCPLPLCAPTEYHVCSECLDPVIPATWLLRSGSIAMLLYNIQNAYVSHR